MNSVTALRLISGGGDVVSTLETLLADAKDGKVDGFAIVTITGDELAANWAHVDDLPHVWARFVAAIAHLNHHLLTEGLTDA